ncbi:MAG: SLBB domain-containing protein [Opitutales bacterium]|nr:SLBB domain-containing protein [Opitutales bacterium]
MKKIILSFFIYSFSATGFLFAQVDPALMAKLSALTPQQRQQLLDQRSSGRGDFQRSFPSAELNTRSVEVEAPDEESFDTRSNFLTDLSEMEELISSDIIRLEKDQQEDRIVIENYNALEESKALLRKIKQVQRREIEKRADEFGKSEADPIKPFGYDLFASDPSTFAPGNEVPIPSDYRIGPGDLVEIQLFGQRNESYSLGISREGMIRFPGIGPINAFEKGTSFIELKNHLKETIRKQLGEGVQSSITLGAFRSIRIFLLGEVRKQGAYTVSALSTTINALLSCGGIKDTGSLRNIKLKRAGEVIASLDLYDLLLRGDTRADQPLQPGDVIFVPVVEKQITVSGAVRRPAKYEIKGGETLQSAFELAGGSSNRSILDFIRLERMDDDFRLTIKNLNFASDAKFKIQNGDQISIGFTGSSVKNVVSLIGAVENLGDYEWKNGLTLNDLIKDPFDLLPNADLHYGLIRRKKPNGDIHCLSFIPADLFRREKGNKVSLNAQDLVYFFPRESREDLLEGLIRDLRNQSASGENSRIVRISGSVHFAGDYPFSDAMTLADLFRAAGGTRDSAYMLDAEVTRIGLDQDQSAFVKHIRLSPKQLADVNSSKQFTLEPYDAVSIKPIPLWKEGERIEIQGEVKFPGFYSIKNGETLYDVIVRAGGITDRAFPQGAIFSRENLRVKEDEQRGRLIAQLESDLATATLSAKDSEDAAQAQSAARAMLARLQNTESQGRLVIDLSKIIKATEKAQLVVKSGDLLVVPEIPYAVSVSGEVQFPSSHLHEEKLALSDYLNRSGGFTQNADKGRTFVVKANGSVMTKGGNAWFGKGTSSNQISPGDVIVVPIDVKQTRFLENLTYSTQIIYQLAVAAAAVNSF